ncbi:ribosomal protein S15 [Lobulomyces angularis]|nr:ribosomal protein S15 [Lobulomyces angularis]
MVTVMDEVLLKKSIEESLMKHLPMELVSKIIQLLELCCGYCKKKMIIEKPSSCDYCKNKFKGLLFCHLCLKEAAQELKKKRTFRKFTFRGIELSQLLDLSNEQLMDLVHARARRRFQRGLKRKPMGLIKKLRKARKETPSGEKPDTVKTHLRDMIIVPEMIGSVCGVYNGKTFITVEIKPEMVGHYLGEFSITYKPVRHGRSGAGNAHSQRFIPLK